MYSLGDFFTDPLLRAPTLGTLFMCVTASLVGVIVLIRRRSLLGETLSHAAYPGIVIAALFFSSFFSSKSGSFSFVLLLGAFVFSFLGLAFLYVLQRRFKVKNDSALCFVLSSFFGIGVLFSSRIQYTQPLLYRQIQGFLYGQPATMTDDHVLTYALLCCAVMAFFLFFYRQIQIVNFDPLLAETKGISVKAVEFSFFFFLVLAVTIAIRGVGLILLSGMLIAPALAARQWTSCLAKMLSISAFLGALSAFSGNYISATYSQIGPNRLVLPIGPLILLLSSFFCFLSLFLSPKKGLLIRFLRKSGFYWSCQQENLLKFLWKRPGKKMTFQEIHRQRRRSLLSTWLLLQRALYEGWMEKKERQYFLSHEGTLKAERIVRLHCLWEVYLVWLGQSQEKVHASAEEMEHILTPELETCLLAFLQRPTQDPQAILGEQQYE